MNEHPVLRRLALVGGLLVAFALWAWLHAHDRKVDNAIQTKTLPPAGIARVLVDVKHRTVTTIDKTGKSTTAFVGSSGASVDVSKSGSIRVLTRSWGTEAAPFIALGIAGKPIVGVGADVFYIRKFDIGPAVAFPLGGSWKDTRLALVGSYNVWSNTRISLGYDTSQHFGAFVSVRL